MPMSKINFFLGFCGSPNCLDVGKSRKLQANYNKLLRIVREIKVSSGRQRRRSRSLAGRPLPKEALRQLSDTYYYAKVDRDPTFINQNIVKNTINDLLAK